MMRYIVLQRFSVRQTPFDQRSGSSIINGIVLDNGFRRSHPPSFCFFFNIGLFSGAERLCWAAVAVSAQEYPCKAPGLPARPYRLPPDDRMGFRRMQVGTASYEKALKYHRLEIAPGLPSDSQ